MKNSATVSNVVFVVSSRYASQQYTKLPSVAIALVRSLPKYRIDDYTFTIAQLPLLNPHHMHLVEANYLNYRHRFTAKPFLQLTKITYKPVIKSTDILLYPLHKVTI